MKITVCQTFETLGDPCRKTFSSMGDAVQYRDTLAADIARMVSDTDTPSEFNPQTTGYISEIKAWEHAAEIAGVDYDEDGQRTGPDKYGFIAGQFIASKCVSVDTEED